VLPPLLLASATHRAVGGQAVCQTLPCRPACVFWDEIGTRSQYQNKFLIMVWWHDMHRDSQLDSMCMPPADSMLRHAFADFADSMLS
jgi:hypothetical protein